MKLKDPCKICLVRPMCHTICDKRADYSDIYQFIFNWYLLVAVLVNICCVIILDIFTEYNFYITSVLVHIGNLFLWWFYIRRKYFKIQNDVSNRFIFYRKLHISAYR